MLEGSRRLSLVLGLLGGAVGLIGAWDQWGSLREAGATWAEYESLSETFSPSKEQASVKERVQEGIDRKPRFKVGDRIPLSMIEESNKQGKKEKPWQSKPTFTDYFGIVLWPVWGFLLPWGTVRTSSWVVEGFVKDWRARRKGT